jgi:hypothetical protein
MATRAEGLNRGRAKKWPFKPLWGTGHIMASAQPYALLSPLPGVHLVDRGHLAPARYRGMARMAIPGIRGQYVTIQQEAQAAIAEREEPPRIGSTVPLCEVEPFHTLDIP